MKPRDRVRIFAVAAWLPLASAGCGGASFDDPSLIKGLRVLAVQKDPPYPQPGERVKIKLLYWDAKATEDAPRSIQVAFLPCENPRGDLYYNCLADLVNAGDGGPPPEDGGPIASSDSLPRIVGEPPGTLQSELPAPQSTHIRETSIPISEDIIDRRPQNPVITPYGLAYMLFVACAGRVAPAPGGVNTLPIGCFDADGKRLGSDDFILGYTSMYVYKERRNANPIIDDLRIEGVSLAGSTTADLASLHHIPRCTSSDRASCPKHAFKVHADPSSGEVEDDPAAVGPNGQRFKEQVWVSLYTTGGTFKSSTRLMNDATRGWNEDNGTEFTAPAEPGPVRLFGVVHDNRGGTSFTEGKIIVD